MLPITGSHNLVLWEEGGTLCVLRKELVTTLGDAGDNCAVKVGSHTFTAKLVSEGNYPHRAPKRKIDTCSANGTPEEMEKALEEYVAKVLQPTTLQNYPSTFLD